MENKETKEFSLSGVKFAAPGGTQFAIEDRTWGEKEYETAAAEISGTFETYVTQLRHAAFCGDYYNSKDWSGAETNCLRALEMNPADTQTRLIYALVRKEQGRDQESYEEVLKVIETDPLNEDALNLAGHQAAILERPDEARQHYTRYLQLQPENAPVRMRVAYDLATAGDSEGAMLLIEEGLQLDDTNVEMLLQHASFATRGRSGPARGHARRRAVVSRSRQAVPQGTGFLRRRLRSAGRGDGERPPAEHDRGVLPAGAARRRDPDGRARAGDPRRRDPDLVPLRRHPQAVRSPRRRRGGARGAGGPRPRLPERKGPAGKLASRGGTGRRRLPVPTPSRTSSRPCRRGNRRPTTWP